MTHLGTLRPLFTHPWVYLAQISVLTTVAEREGATDSVVDDALDSRDPTAALIDVLQGLGVAQDPEPERARRLSGRFGLPYDAPEPERALERAPEPEPELWVADPIPESPEAERASPLSLRDRIAAQQRRSQAPTVAAAAPLKQQQQQSDHQQAPSSQPQQGLGDRQGYTRQPASTAESRPSNDRAVEIAVARALAQLGIGAGAPQPPPLFGMTLLEVEPRAVSTNLSPAQLKERLFVAQDAADTTAVALERGNAQIEARLATAERLEAAGDFNAALRLIATTRDVMNRTRSGLALEAALVAMDQREASVGLAKAKDQLSGAAGAAGMAQLHVQQQRGV